MGALVTSAIGARPPAPVCTPPLLAGTIIVLETDGQTDTTSVHCVELAPLVLLAAAPAPPAGKGPVDVTVMMPHCDSGARTIKENAAPGDPAPPAWAPPLPLPPPPPAPHPRIVTREHPYGQTSLIVWPDEYVVCRSVNGWLEAFDTTNTDYLTGKVFVLRQYCSGRGSPRHY
jgi:hypothetical protein